MAFTPYATLADLTAWLGKPAPADPEGTRLLNRATEKIDRVLIGAVYAVDANGMPTDTVKVIPALRNAVCAQVEWWLGTAEELVAMEGIHRHEVGGVVVEGSAGADHSLGPASLAIRPQVAPRALECLQVAGLLPPTIIA